MAIETNKGLSHHGKVVGVDLRKDRIVLACAVARWGSLRSVEVEELHVAPTDPDAAAALEAVLQTRGWLDLPFVVGLRGADTILRSMELPPGDPRSMKDVLAEKLEQFAGVSSREVIHSYDAVYRGDGSVRVLLGLTRNEAAENAVALPIEAGLRLHQVMPAAIGLYNGSVRTLMDGDGPCLILDAGPRATEVVIATTDEVLFARSFSALLDSADPVAVEEWGAALQTCLTLYHSDAGNGGVTWGQVCVYGDAERAEVKACVQQVTGVMPNLVAGPVELADRYPVAVGLALSGVRQGEVELSLLPRPVQDRICLRWQCFYWSLACAVLLMTGAALAGMTRWSLHKKHAALEVKQEEWRWIEREIARLERSEQAAVGLLRQVAPLRIAVANGDRMGTLMRVLSAAKHPDDWVLLLADARSYERSVSAVDLGPEGEFLVPFSEVIPEEANDLSGGLDIHRVILEGFTPVDDLSTVNTMIELLREDPLVLEADLLGDDRLRIDAARDSRWSPFGVRLFAIEITVDLP